MKEFSYPKARTVDQVDEYHGVRVSDPYRWMEKLEDPDLKPWLEIQEELTEKVLSSIPCREKFRGRLKELSKSRGVGIPYSRGNRWFQSRSAGDLEHAGLYLVDHPSDKEGKLLLKPRSLGDNVMVTDIRPSPDGSRILFSKSIGGSDWKTWHVMEVDTGEHLDDYVEDAKLWAAWLPDSSGFLYLSFPSQEGEGTTRETSRPQLWLHEIGTEQETDLQLYEDNEDPHYFFPTVTTDGCYLVITPIYMPKVEILYSRIGEWNFEVLTSADEQLWFVGNRGDEFFFTTTQDAPFGRVVAVNRSKPHEDLWRTVVPESDKTLLPYESALVGDRVLAIHDYLGRSTVSLHSLDKTDSYTLDLPEVSRVVSGSVVEPFGISSNGGELYFSVTSPTSPSNLVRHDVAARETEVVFKPSGTPDLEVISEVVWTESRDGTRVPMTLVRSAENREKNPAVLIEGYGGGGDIMHPHDFSAWKVSWFEAGGVVATAHLRGGRELGAEWQSAAARGGKLKAMEDFVGCAEYLVNHGVTTAERIGITGRSSGAMLAAAAVIRRPELFGACVAEVGMFDPLRYHLFGLGRLMIGEYGTSENAEDFPAMFAYSPLHRVTPGTAYPPMLLTVHTDDDRVAPGSPYKFAATMQEAQAAKDKPIILRLRSGAGHFGGSPSGEVEERGDILAFLGMALKLEGC
jgi:prolyl oligopeptidase